MDEGRLPTHLEVSGLIRRVQAAGGFATVLHKGERDAGSLALVVSHRGTTSSLWERMPQLDGSRKFVASRTQDVDKPYEFSEYLDRRARQDSDLWILELDVADPERFIA
ncbi:DUF1491 family protein [Erythrobacter litoralis]|uniref:DUF1491 family protein n=1 Tax=Erythrobacter litoralis TaxID=39960 RepID=UPI002434B7EC|nr:DUF1491 family protein [Erythrobacter litoralis]MDG6079431.1 DUF1491 family protein [Erythrobacter litoralis]